MSSPIQGFSKLDKEAKIDWIAERYTQDPEAAKALFRTYWNNDARLQQLHDEFIENTLTNYYLPLGIAPNFLIDDRLYAIPMAIEESSVVAAASKAAKFWGDRGGFTTEILGTEKIGQVHFMYKGSTAALQAYFNHIKPQLLSDCAALTQSMEKRGGGITDIVLVDKSGELENYFQLHATFETLDAMGANFINSCLEQFAKTFKAGAQHFDGFTEAGKKIEVVMSILSNYVPQCRVRASVSCPVEELTEGAIDGKAFAEKFVQAVCIAEIEPYRAVTHNKGIMNGIDAVILATGNDFRAVEAGVHAYAAKTGRYTSLTHAKIEDGVFHFWIEIPLALGTVGGLTKLHPMVKLALEILQQPDAKALMGIVAVSGLAQNFAALRALVTTGIQQGHMKMHLFNILNQFDASSSEKEAISSQFQDKTVSHSAVVNALKALRE